VLVKMVYNGVSDEALCHHRCSPWQTRDLNWTKVGVSSVTMTNCFAMHHIFLIRICKESKSSCTKIGIGEH
jgi:hypothetical protein